MLIDPGQIAFDIDGVVADTMEVFLALAEKDHGYKGLTQSQITDFDLSNCLPLHPKTISAIFKKISAVDHDPPLKMLPGAKGALKHLLMLGHELVFVTARVSGLPILHWLEQELIPDAEKGNGQSIRVINTGKHDNKGPALEALGRTHLVDDRLETCFDLREQGFNPILFAQPWNRKLHPFVEVENWGELAAKINYRRA